MDKKEYMECKKYVAASKKKKAPKKPKAPINETKRLMTKLKTTRIKKEKRGIY